MRWALVLHCALALSLFGCPGGGSSNHGDGGPGDGGPDGGGDVCGVTGEQTGTIYPGGPLYLSASSPDGQYYVGGVSFALSGTTTLTGAPPYTGDTAQLLDLGAVCGLSAITSIPSAGFTSSLDVVMGHGYAAKLPDGTFARIYVSSIDATAGVNVTYQYPSPVCPAGVTIGYGMSTGCQFTLDGVAQHALGMTDATGCVYPMVACSISATVETWGGGGGGAVPCLGTPGSGGGAGGGGGYGKETVTLTPGTFYVVHSGEGGAPIGGGVTGCSSTPAFGGSSGGTSSFGDTAGSLLVSATGGNGGTGGSTSARSAGGTGGSSNAATNAIGGTGGDGLLNTSCGASAMGPGGAGGMGANGGSGATGGCSAPGTASAPSGGGAGGSQGGAPSPGAQGQVIVSW
jgi:hypothetical protein